MPSPPHLQASLLASPPLPPPPLRHPLARAQRCSRGLAANLPVSSLPPLWPRLRRKPSPLLLRACPWLFWPTGRLYPSSLPSASAAALLRQLQHRRAPPPP